MRVLEKNGVGDGKSIGKNPSGLKLVSLLRYEDDVEESGGYHLVQAGSRQQAWWHLSCNPSIQWVQMGGYHCSDLIFIYASLVVLAKKTFIFTLVN